MINKKYFLTGVLFGLAVLIAFISSRPDGKLHLVFCDVGQGDAIYLRLPNGTDMLVDGGPNDKVLACLGNNMPFHDRQIDIVVLTHPEKDHMQGLISVLERYSVKYFVIGAAGNETEGYKKLTGLIKSQNIVYKNLYQGDYFLLGNIRFNVLWPERNWAAAAPPPSQMPAEAGSGSVLGIATKANLNDFSYFLHLKYGEFDALLTGDGDIKIQDEVMATVDLPDVEVLKFPHHGSKTGIMPELLDKIMPEAAIISSGKNPWGHPTAEALNLLNERGINILRTDQDGEIEVVSDGIKWEIE